MYQPGDALARGEQLLEPGELRDPDRAEKVGQPVVETGRRDVEVAARHDAVVAELAERIGELRLVGRDGPALARGDDLARVERQAAHQAERSARRIPVAGAERAGGVLDEDDILGNGRLQLLPLDRAPEEVDGEHGLRPRRHRVGDAGDVDVERVGIDIDEDGAGSAELDDVRRRRERVGGNDHLVAGADAERQHRQVQRRRAGRDDDRVRGAAGLREPLLELGDLRAHRQHPGRDDLGERGDLGLADVGRRESDAVGHDVAHVPTGRCSRNQAIVRSRPSSSSTCASKPSSSRALPMFGIRSSTST